MKKLEQMLSLAISLASELHLNQYDKGGKPYILHPLWVMNKVRHLGIKAMIVAVLHDVLEDCDITVGQLELLGIDDSEILEALKLLDFRGVDYMTRIQEIYNNPLAKEVKLRDIEHNSKVTRIKNFREKDIERIKKYHTAYNYLKTGELKEF